MEGTKRKARADFKESKKGVRKGEEQCGGGRKKGEREGRVW